MFAPDISFGVKETPGQRLIDEDGPRQTGRLFPREKVRDIEGNQACVPVRKGRNCACGHDHQRWWDSKTKISLKDLVALVWPLQCLYIRHWWVRKGEVDKHRPFCLVVFCRCLTGAGNNT